MQTIPNKPSSVDPDLPLHVISEIETMCPEDLFVISLSEDHSYFVEDLEHFEEIPVLKLL